MNENEIKITMKVPFLTSACMICLSSFVGYKIGKLVMKKQTKKVIEEVKQ